MNQLANVSDQRELSPSQQFRQELEKMGEQFAVALPSHIKPEKFQRVVMTAVLSDPDVLRADRKSLMESAIRAAQDGLLPDKREGAFVVFSTKKKTDGRDEWIKAVQWMPMVGGIIKRIHQSGEIKMLTARVVYGGDHFRTWIDDTGEHVEYEPSEEQDTSVVRRVFAMATTVDGAVYVEPLSSKDVEKIRNVSKQKDRGPWSDWWEEMAKKSAIRRLAKRLPLSVDLHDLIQRDNGLYDLAQEQEPKTSLSDRLKAARNVTPEPEQHREGFSRAFIADQTDEPHDATTGELITNPDTDEVSPASSEDVSASAAAPSEPEVDSSASSGSTLYPTDRADLIECAKSMLLLASLKYDSDKERDEAFTQSRGEWEGKLPKELHEQIGSIFVSTKAVASGKRTTAQAKDWLSEVLKCSIDELGA